MLRLVLPFIGGLVIERHLMTGGFWAGVAAAALFCAWYLVSGQVRDYPKRWLMGGPLVPVLVLLGMFWQGFWAPQKRAGELARFRADGECWRASVIEVISSNDRTMRAWAQMDAAFDSSAFRSVHGGLLLTLMLDSTVDRPGVGDEVTFRSRIDTIQRIPDPGGFDQSSWAASYGVFHTCFVRSDHWLLTRKATGFASFFEGARRRIVRWLGHSDLDDRERGMVKAILLGIRDDLGQDQKTAFARSGTMHVLAVSGSHVAMIYAALLFALRPMGQQRRWKVLRSMIILVLLWSYAGVTGATPSVLRATATFTLFCLADMTGRNSDPVNSLAASAFVLLAMDPLVLGQLSFQLSFLAVLGIAIFYRPILLLWTPPNVVLHYFWSLFAVSIAAQTMTTPLALFSFKAFPMWFLPANMAIVGLVALGVYGGGALILVQWVPVLGHIAAAFMVWLLKLINWFTDLFAWLPCAYPSVRIDAWQCCALYALILLVAAWLFERWSWARTGTIALAAALLVSWGWSARDRNHLTRFIIYDQRDGLACAVEKGRSLTVFADTLDEWTARKVDRHQRAIGAIDVEVRSAMPSRLTAGGFSVVFVAADVLDTARNTEPGIVVLTADVRYDMDRLFHSFRPAGGFVLAPAIAAGRRAYLRRWCAQHEVPVHDVREQGAYVREL